MQTSLQVRWALEDTIGVTCKQTVHVAGNEKQKHNELNLSVEMLKRNGSTVFNLIRMSGSDIQDRVNQNKTNEREQVKAENESIHQGERLLASSSSESLKESEVNTGFY